MIAPETALVGCRFAFYLGALFVWGAAALCLLTPWELRARLWHELKRPLVGAVLLCVIATLAALPIRAAALLSDWHRAIDPAILERVAFQTRLGAAWRYQLLAAALLLVIALVPRLYRKPSAMALGGALVLIAPTLSGHAALHGGGLLWGHRANDWLHLLAAGFWFGALYPVWRLLGHLDTSEQRRAASLGLIRFSRAGHIAVALVIASGIGNTWLVLGGWPGASNSLYQTLLWAKVALVVSMVGIALFNRYRLVPEMQTTAAPGALLRLKRMTLLEIALAMLVLGLVAAFGMLNPG